VRQSNGFPKPTKCLSHPEQWAAALVYRDRTEAVLIDTICERCGSLLERLKKYHPHTFLVLTEHGNDMISRRN